jgi:tRNA uridine 5-carbamoylmethylation protein Kti12
MKMMKVIFIKGLPGVGKSTITKRLTRTLAAQHINVDKFKREAKTGNFRKDRLYAYKKTLRELNKFKKAKKDYVVIDEIFYNKKFVGDLLKFIKKNKANAYWFRITRPTKELLKIEKERKEKHKKRKIRNKLKDFLYLQKNMNLCKVRGEVIIKNKKTSETINFILEKVRK